MSVDHEQRVTTVRNSESIKVPCIFGDTVMPFGYDTSEGPVWLHTEIDGHPVCFEHIMLIANERTVRGIHEGAIKKALIRNDERNRRAKAEAQLRRGVGRSEPGWIYYARIGELIKIGFTVDLAGRIASYPPNTQLLAAHPGTRAVETEMHQRFAELRTRGREWFRPGKVLETHISDVRQRFGDPTGAIKPMRHSKSGRTKTLATNVLT